MAAAHPVCPMARRPQGTPAQVRVWRYSAREKRAATKAEPKRGAFEKRPRFFAKAMKTKTSEEDSPCKRGMPRVARRTTKRALVLSKPKKSRG